jgi:hypothetical protein
MPRRLFTLSVIWKLGDCDAKAVDTLRLCLRSGQRRDGNHHCDDLAVPNIDRRHIALNQGGSLAIGLPPNRWLRRDRCRNRLEVRIKNSPPNQRCRHGPVRRPRLPDLANRRLQPLGHLSGLPPSRAWLATAEAGYSLHGGGRLLGSVYLSDLSAVWTAARPPYPRRRHCPPAPR